METSEPSFPFRLCETLSQSVQTALEWRPERRASTNASWTPIPAWPGWRHLRMESDGRCEWLWGGRAGCGLARSSRKQIEERTMRYFSSTLHGE